MKEVKITREPIELHKLLKFEGLATSGGEAKKSYPATASKSATQS
jgi:ribosome-associated protein YbcJ (S4-like RNA binding protein)